MPSTHKRQPADRRQEKLVWYGLCKWGTKRTGGKIGVALSQALLESYAFVIELKLSLSEQSRVRVQVHGATEGTMELMDTLGAKSPHINALAGEAAFVAAPLGLELAANHIWSGKNSWADALSRVVEGCNSSICVFRYSLCRSFLVPVTHSLKHSALTNLSCPCHVSGATT